LILNMNTNFNCELLTFDGCQQPVESESHFRLPKMIREPEYFPANMLAFLDSSFGSSDERAASKSFSEDSPEHPVRTESCLAESQKPVSSTGSSASSSRLASTQQAIEKNHRPDNLRINAGGPEAKRRARLPDVPTESAAGQDSVGAQNVQLKRGDHQVDLLSKKQLLSASLQIQTCTAIGTDTPAAQSALEANETVPPRRGDSNLTHKRDCCADSWGQVNLSTSGLEKIRSRLNDDELASEEFVDDPVEQGILASKYTEAQILTLCLKDKPSSIAVQKHLSKLSQANLDRVTGSLSKELDRLLTDRFGSYVIQHLVESHLPTLRSVAATISNNFIKYSTNEFSSRIMQRMFQLDQEFSVRCFELMKKYFKQLVNNFSGSILLTKLVACVIGDAHYTFVIKILEQNKEYLRKAYFNRMLSTLVSCCSDQILDQVVQHIKSHVWALMNDKFGNCILQTIFQRNHEGGIALIRQACAKHINTLLIRRYPKLLLINLIHEGRAGPLPHQLLQAFVAAGCPSVQTIIERRESASLFLLMLAQCSDSQRRSLAKTLQPALSSPAKHGIRDPDLAEALATYMSL
jgi:hypothetical protein